MAKSKLLCKEWILLLVGCIIYSASMTVIKGVNVIPGSMLGIAVAVNRAFEIQIGLVNFLLNIPIMITATRKMGLKVLIYTAVIILLTSLLIDWWVPIIPDMPVTNPYILASVSGSIMGIGAGLLIRAGGTMAGTTALTLLLQPVLKKLSFGTILFFMDAAIVLMGTIMVGDWKAVVYSLLYSFCCAKVMDIVIDYRRK